MHNGYGKNALLFLSMCGIVIVSVVISSYIRLQLEDFAWKTNLFLRNVGDFKETLLEIGPETQSLLEDVLNSVSDLLNTVTVNNDIRCRKPFRIDHKHCVVRYLIMCRLCAVSEIQILFFAQA